MENIDLEQYVDKEVYITFRASVLGKCKFATRTFIRRAADFYGVDIYHEEDGDFSNHLYSVAGRNLDKGATYYDITHIQEVNP